jgi:hypothetical protein
MAFTYTHLNAAIVGDADRWVASANMKVGAYTLLNSGANPTPGTARKVTLARTVAGAADTPGTIVIVGKNLAGQTITESMIPGAHGVTVTSTNWFASITSVTGVGWVIGEANDTIVVGIDGNYLIVAEGTGTLHSITINTTAAGSITLADAKGTIGVLPANATVGQYLYGLGYSGYLRCELVAASDVTVVHTGSHPTYATA